MDGHDYYDIQREASLAFGSGALPPWHELSEPSRRHWDDFALELSRRDDARIDAAREEGRRAAEEEHAIVDVPYA